MSDEPRTVGSTATLRLRRDPADRIPPPKTSVRVVVYHSGYGCDTGCCGHVVELDGERTDSFEFGHPEEGELREWAEELAKKEVYSTFGAAHVADLDWEHCDVVTHDGDEP